MRFVIDVRDEQDELLRELALDGHRSIREQAAYLLFLKIKEEYARLKQRPPENIIISEAV